MMIDIRKLTKQVSKRKLPVLNEFTIKVEKSASYSVTVNGNYAGSSSTYATAELLCLIQGAALWQLDEIALPFGEVVRMKHIYPHMGRLQLMSYDSYIGYLTLESQKA